ncbi:hypothetical protein CMV30_10130 [Nibricoccus aquaticus]|uniref:Transposase IS4-like domain-containing protein n=1 Tax=Nibricoccus aquaticus TaxID=2576891 RepID=A0A290QAQ8_9BACT|nr:hypothetical protein CMV30_10130 [Nibricoccus aquaticus]
MRAETRCRDLPDWFGPWKSACNKFRRWATSGLWECCSLLSMPLTRDYEHPISTAPALEYTSTPQDRPAASSPKASLSTKIHLAGDALGYPRDFITGANVSNQVRSQTPPFTEHLYRERHRIENLFARLNRYRRISTRYEKLLSSFSAMLMLA